MPEATQLTEAEFKIMQLLWEQSPRTMMELTRALEAETHWTKYTVITLLKRMQQKGTVRVSETGAVKTYAPAVAKNVVARERTDSLLSHMFSGRASLLVNNLVENGRVSQQEIQEMLDILRKASE